MTGDKIDLVYADHQYVDKFREERSDEQHQATKANHARSTSVTSERLGGVLQRKTFDDNQNVHDAFGRLHARSGEISDANRTVISIGQSHESDSVHKANAQTYGVGGVINV